MVPRTLLSTRRIENNNAFRVLILVYYHQFHVSTILMSCMNCITHAATLIRDTGTEK